MDIKMFGYIMLGILCTPAIMVIAYSVLAIGFRMIVMLYTQAFSVMGWDAPRRYAEYHWGL